MATSQNGYTANNAALCSSRPVAGTSPTVNLMVRKGPAGDLLLEVAALFHRFVQPIDQGIHDDWGYAARPIRGSSTTSNHASGTAIDLNATRWSLGQSPSVNLNPSQIAKVREIVSATGGVVRWGGDYSGRKDPMHFEINDNRTEGQCARALADLIARWGGNHPNTPTTPVQPPAPPANLEETLVQIALSYYDDNGKATPEGLNFRASVPVEVGDNSAVVKAAWVRWCCYWGTMTGVRVVFWGLPREVSGAAPMGEAQDTARVDNVQVPLGARGLTVEGRRSGPGTQPSFALLALPH